jgi:pantoate--beta-alanine ligase
LNRETAFIALGSTAPDARARFSRALEALATGDTQVAAVARIVVGPFLDRDGHVVAGAPSVSNTVAQISTVEDPRALLARLLAIEQAAGRVRDGSTARALDLDLLALGAHEIEAPGLTLPHPRASGRAFVLLPWEEIAPTARVGRGGPTVMALASSLRARAPEAFRALQAAPPPELPAREGRCERLEDLGSLRAWRAGCSGTVGLVPTMGALHAGHMSLVRHARSRCDHVVATIFVNPLQFAPGEDLARYPRTLDDDLAALRSVGADAVYLPAPEDLYAKDFSTYVTPTGPAEGFEGARRPGHFQGVATIVTKLLLRVHPTHGFFGRKDAQQVAVIARMVRDLDLPGHVIVCPTVRDPDGLALSSRNRYLDEAQRTQALCLDRALSEMQFATSSTVHRDALRATGLAILQAAAVEVEYLDVVDPATMVPIDRLDAAALAIGVIRVGETRLLDNRWMAPAGEGA